MFVKGEGLGEVEFFHYGEASAVGQADVGSVHHRFGNYYLNSG